MLVLLIMFIITIPIQTHAVKMNMPVNQSATPPRPPEIVRIDVDFDGTIGWNGTIVADRHELEAKLAAVADAARPARGAPAPEQAGDLQGGGDDPGLGAAPGRDEDRHRRQRAIL